MNVQNRSLLAEAEDYPFMRRSFVSEEDTVREIQKLILVLPEWITPHMVYPESSIQATKTLGHGHYGEVQQGVFCHRNAV